jgi:hypothetical protein
MQRVHGSGCRGGCYAAAPCSSPSVLCNNRAYHALHPGTQSRQSARPFGPDAGEDVMQQHHVLLLQCEPFGRGTHSLAGEAVGGSQFGRGDRHRGTRGIYLYFVPRYQGLWETLANRYRYQLIISNHYQARIWFQSEPN